MFQRAAVHGSAAVVCEVASGSTAGPSADPRPRIHFLHGGVPTRSVELPTEAWIAGLAFDGHRAALVASLDEQYTRFECWLVEGSGALARAELPEELGLHEVYFSPDGRELLIFSELALNFSAWRDGTGLEGYTAPVGRG